MIEGVSAVGAGPPDWSMPELRIDADGDWWDGTERVTHAGILANLSASLQRDDHGYFVQTRVRIPVAVVDTPFVVTRIARIGDRLRAWLTDGTDATIDPATLRVSPENIPHCLIPRGFEARLNRAAAFQLLGLLESDEGGYGLLRLGDRAYVIPGVA